MFQRWQLIPLLPVILLASCKPLLSPQKARQALDGQGPVIVLSTPGNGQAYAAYTGFSGTVSDSTQEGQTGSIASLQAEVVGLLAPQEVAFAEDGSFADVLNTSGPGFSDDIVLRLAAEDWNGNRTELSITLVKQTGEIPSFSVTPASRSASLSWEAVPGALSYTVYELRSGLKLEGLTSTSHAFQELDNGRLYTFQLAALFPADEVHYSARLNAIPLSPFTLLPKLRPGFEQIRLCWRSIPAAQEYVIERATSREGPFAIRTIHRENSFLDTEVNAQQTYYYRVYPVEIMDDPQAIKSYPAAAEPEYFPSGIERIKTTCDTPSWATQVVLQGDFAYIADQGGMAVVDLSDPLAPVLAGYCHTPGIARGIAVSGDYAYVADYDHGLQVIDVSDPYAIDDTSIVGSCNFGLSADDPGSAEGVAVAGGYAFVACRNAGLRVVDVSVPDAVDNTSHLASCDTPGYAIAVTVSGSYAFVADGSLRVINVSNPAAVTDLSLVASCACSAQDVQVQGGLAYVASGSGIGLSIVDVSTPSAVTDASVVGTVSVGTSTRAVAVSGDLAFLVDGVNLHALDVSTPSDPRWIFSCDTPAEANGVAAAGGYAFVADLGSGLQVIDCSHPALSAGPASYATTGSANRLRLDGDRVLVAAGSGGLCLFSRSADGGLSPLGSRATSQAQAVAAAGDYALIADDTAGIKIIDLATAGYPVTGSLATSWAYGIDSLGDYAYVANLNAGLSVIDISNPAQPRAAAAFPLSDARDVLVWGHYAFVAAGSSGLVVLDIADPLNPRQAGSCHTDYARSLWLTDAAAYVADDSSGLKIVDIGDPAAVGDTSLHANPLPTLSEACGVAYTAGFALVALQNTGLIIASVQVPDQPRLAGNIDLTPYLYGVAVAGRHAYVANGSNGLKAFDLQP